jgi:5-formyltetrahydrofolate cyclo-ligase
LFPTVEVGVLSEKQELRRSMRGRRLALSAEEVASRSERACSHLLDHLHPATPRGVAVGGPRPNEIDPGPAARALADGGAVVVYPRVVGARPPRLSFHRAVVGDLRAQGRLGIPEPDPSAPEIALTDLDVIVVPGLAFDREGHRLGYGGGFYDALAALAPRARRIGLAYGFQIVERCPRGADDHAVELVVTEDGPIAEINCGGPR